MKHITLILPIILCGMCRQPEPLPTIHEIETVAIVGQTEVVQDLMQFVKSIELIRLDSVITVAGTNKIVRYRDRFITDALVEFDLTGKMVKKYGKLGRGPGEYLHIIDYCIDFDERELLCLNHQNEILRYSLEDGAYKGTIKTGLRGMTAKAVFPLSKDKVALFVPNPPTADLRKLDKPFYCLKMYNSKGELIGEDLPREDFNISLFRVPSTQISNNRYTLSFTPGSGSSFLFDRTGYAPRFFLDLGEKSLPEKYAFRQGNNPGDAVEDIFEQDYLKCPAALCPSESWTYGAVFGEASSVWNYLIPASGRKGIRWQSVGGMNPPMIGLASDEEAVYVCYSESFGKTDDPLAELIIKEAGDSLSGSDNPIIAKVSFIF